MTPDINDKITFVALGTKTELAAPGYTAGAGSINIADPTNWVDETAIHFAMDEVNSAGRQVVGSYRSFKGVRSGSAIGDLTLTGGGADRDFAAGATTRVYMTVGAARENEVMEAFLVDHDTQGRTKHLTDTNGNIILALGAIASADNYLKISNAVAGSRPVLEASGSDTNIDVEAKGKGTGRFFTDGLPPQMFADELTFDCVASGCVWSGDAYGSNRNASMTAGAVYMGGKRLTVAAVTGRTFLASKDTYIDARDNGDGTAILIYTDVANNAASPSLTAGDMRIGIIVAGASTVADAGSVNQGQEEKVLPIRSSIAMAVTDEIGNLICPRDPTRKILGYRRITSNFSTTSTSAAQVTGLTAPFLIPAGRKVKATLKGEDIYHNSANIGAIGGIWVGAVGVGSRIGSGRGFQSSGSGAPPLFAQAIHTPSSTSVTLNASLHVVAAGTATIDAGATNPVELIIELK